LQQLTSKEKRITLKQKWYIFLTSFYDLDTRKDHLSMIFFES
jgi:hypothetical protein